MRSADKIAFVVSVAVLAYFGGFVTRARGWFPSDVLQEAWTQVGQVFGVNFTAPRVYDRTGPRILDDSRMQPGLTLIVSTWRDPDESRWIPGLRLIDARGRIHHEWRVDPKTLFPDSVKRGIRMTEFDIQGSHLFPDGDVVVNVEYLGTARLDACGRPRWTLAEGNHHSVARDDDGSFWLPAVTRRGPPTSRKHPDGFPGLSGPLYQDLILHVSGDGEILDRINVLDVLYANGLQRHIVKAKQLGGSDITHVNDVEPLGAARADEYPLFDEGDLVVSLRHLDLVFVFDPGSGRVKWHASEPFIHQHDPDFIGDGWIGVFDNNRDGSGRGQVLGGSRIVAVQPHTDSVRTLFPRSSSAEPFYTDQRGKWQQLENGNLLLTESAAGRVLEVTPGGKPVWDWVVEPYDDYRVPLVSKGLRTDLTREDVQSWPCSHGERRPNSEQRRNP